MSYHSLRDALIDLEKNNQLIKINTEVDPHLEMAAIHLRINEMKGPALWFQNIKNTKFTAASNIFGTYDRTKFLFRDTFQKTEWLIKKFKNPIEIFQKPFQNLNHVFFAIHAIPKKQKSNLLKHTCQISDIPLIHHWPKDGGAFITLPQVYSENIEKPGLYNSNLGMYRIQLTGNDYILNKEIGLHYQLHRGIGIHQQIAMKNNQEFKISIFIGGPPAHTLAAIMPLPETMSELMFAGLLAGRRFRYYYQNGYLISTDADFVITGNVEPNLLKPEGPFGDHLGYYSLQHSFPVLSVKNIYHKQDAVWPFTVVGRPPQEDSVFGKIVHELTGWALQKEIYGLKDLYAVDEAGVHPLLLATGSERYTPYLNNPEPSEILTIAHHIMGTGQLSLLKYLFITAEYDEKVPPCHDVQKFFQYILERIDLKRDIHFYTNTSLDTLDYSSGKLNKGSKLVVAAYGNKIRELYANIPPELQSLQTFFNPQIIFPGVLILEGKTFENYQTTKNEIQILHQEIQEKSIPLHGFPLIVITDDSHFVSRHINNWLWVTFTRSNPASDVYGLNEKINHHHFEMDNLIIDARLKPHHAPVLEKDKNIEKKIDKMFSKGGELYEWFSKNKVNV